MNKLTKKFLNSFRAGESGFTLIELLIVIAILGILAAVIIPNASKFIGTSHVASANTELAQVETAAQAAAGAATNGTLTAGIIDQAGLAAGTNAADVAIAPYITGKLVGAYWITASGTVFFETPGTTGGCTTPTSSTNPTNGTIVTGGGTPAQGDPSYANLYFNETTDQFVSSMPLNNGGSGPDAATAP